MSNPDPMQLGNGHRERCENRHGLADLEGLISYQDTTEADRREALENEAGDSVRRHRQIVKPNQMPA